MPFGYRGYGRPTAAQTRTSTTGSTTGRRRGADSGAQDPEVVGPRANAVNTVRQIYNTTPGVQTDFRTFFDEMDQIAQANGTLWQWGQGAGTQPATPGGGSSGYGGGGGGGGAALTQQMIDAMARALGAQGPQYSYTPVNLPDFQGANLPAFNAAPWQQMLGQINTAVTADQANITQNSQQLQNTLNNNYTNPYATATVTPGATAAPIGAGLMGTVGGQSSAAPAQQANAQNADSQAAFQNLLGILGAADQSAQNSRMAQVPMDANYATQGLNAQALGMRGQVGMAQTQAQQQWAQQDAERRYQNSLMQQQWNREEQQANATGANQAALTNYQTNSAAQQARLQPILDLIMNSAGTTGLNFEALFRALGIAA